jgi:hypothetical protein
MEGEPEINAAAYGLVQITERNSDGGPLLSEENENLLRSFPGVSLVLGQAFEQGWGSIHISNR